VGLLVGVEVPVPEIAQDLGVAPVIELTIEGEMLAVSLAVLPGQVRAVAGHGVAEDVGAPVAAVVDVAGAEEAVDGTVRIDAVIAGGGSDHDAARGVEADVRPEVDAGGHRQVE